MFRELSEGEKSRVSDDFVIICNPTTNALQNVLKVFLSDVVGTTLRKGQDNGRSSVYNYHSQVERPEKNI